MYGQNLDGFGFDICCSPGYVVSKMDSLVPQQLLRYGATKLSPMCTFLALTIGKFGKITKFKFWCTFLTLGFIARFNDYLGI